MRTARRVGVFCALLTPLLAAAVYLALHGTRASPSPSPTPTRGAGPESESALAPAASSLRARALAEARSAVHRQRRVEARRESPGSEFAPPPARLARGAQGAVSAAERFWAAFSRYQVGQLRREVRRELRATATRNFVRALLRSPPRVSSSAGPDAAEMVGGLDFVPRSYRGRALVGAEVVGQLAGGRRGGLLAFQLERTREGWRVAALSR